VTEGTGQQHQVAGDWDTYWRGTHENAAHQEGSPQDIVLAQYWGELFARQLDVAAPRCLLDLACGNGAVTGFALQAAPQVTVCCLDYSASAVIELQKRYPAALCVSADALQTPFASASFDVVASQFGVEYAGSEAVGEAARLVAPGGVLALILHLHEGGIYRECERNLAAVETIQASKLMVHARAAFSSSFELNAGVGTLEDFKAAQERLAPAVQALRQLVDTMGSDVASGLPEKLYRDIAHMYRRMAAYEQEDIMQWIDGMVSELEAYAGRMSSMLNAAVNSETMQGICTGLSQQGFTVLKQHRLKMGPESEAAAWVLECQRQ